MEQNNTDQSIHSTSSILKKQRTSLLLRRRSSVKNDAKDFEKRQQDGQQWEHDSDVKSCRNCESKFTIANRKHHCRSCGSVFCGKCSAYKVVVSGELKRACQQCYQAAISKPGSKVIGSFDDTLNTDNANPNLNNASEQPRSLSSDQQQSSPLTSYVMALSPDDSSRSNSSSFSTTANTANDWIEAIVFINRTNTLDTTYKSYCCSVPAQKLSAEMLIDIQNTALPPTDYKSSNLSTSQKFMFRLRDKSVTGPVFEDDSGESVGTAVTLNTMFFNCFVHLETSLLANFAIIVITRWPVMDLANQILDRLLEALMLQANRRFSSVSSDDNTFKKYLTNDQNSCSAITSIDQSTIESVLEVAVSQITEWPGLRPATLSVLTFFGDMIHCTIPSDIFPYKDEGYVNPSVYHLGLQYNICEIFGCCGLLPHLWFLWELLITSKDILVVCNNPAQCSQVVLALTSLLEPFIKCGDFRPVLNATDADLLVLTATAQLKQLASHEGNVMAVSDVLQTVAALNRPMIVGIYDPMALRQLDDFTTAIFIPPNPQSASIDNNHMSDAVFKGMRKKNTAELVIIDGKKDAHTDTKTPDKVEYKFGKIRQKRSSLVGSMLKSNVGAVDNTFYGHYLHFLSSANSSRSSSSSKAMIVSKIKPSSFPLKPLLKRVQRLLPEDRLIFGDKILRDNLVEITRVYVTAAQQSQPVASLSVDVTPTTNTASSSSSSTTMRSISIDNKQQSVEHSMNVREKKVSYFQQHIKPFLQLHLATIIMYALIIIGLSSVWYLFSLPSYMIIAIVFVVKLPDQPPQVIVGLVDLCLADKPALTATSNTTAITAASNVQRLSSDVKTTESVAPTVVTDQQKADLQRQLTGVWKRVKVDNYESFLAAQGANYLQRKLAASLSMTHSLCLSDSQHVRLLEKGGPIDNDYTYPIAKSEKEDEDDGIMLATQTMQTKFEDHSSWTFTNSPHQKYIPCLLIRKVKLPERAYELLVYRWVEESAYGSNKQLHMKAVYHPRTFTAGQEDVIAYCTFDFVSAPSSVLFASLPHSDQVLSKGASSKHSDSNQLQRPDLNGTWLRTRSENIEAFIAASGGSYLQRKFAAQMSLTHIITMDMPKGLAFRLQERGGPLSSDFTLTVGAETFMPVSINGKGFTQRCYWDDQTLVLIRRSQDTTLPPFEHILSRTLMDNSTGSEQQIVLRAVHRDLQTEKETEAVSFFQRTGASPNPPPQPDASLLPALINAESSRDEKPPQQQQASDDEEDEDDEAALAKMKSKSAAQQKQRHRWGFTSLKLSR